MNHSGTNSSPLVLPEIGKMSQAAKPSQARRSLASHPLLMTQDHASGPGTSSTLKPRMD